MYQAFANCMPNRCHHRNSKHSMGPDPVARYPPHVWHISAMKYIKMTVTIAPAAFIVFDDLPNQTSYNKEYLFILVAQDRNEYPIARVADHNDKTIRVIKETVPSLVCTCHTNNLLPQATDLEAEGCG